MRNAVAVWLPRRSSSGTVCPSDAVPLGNPGREDVPDLERAALVPAEGAERIGRAAAEDERDIDPARNRHIGPGTPPQIVEGQDLSRRHREARPGRARFAIELRRQFGARHRHHRIGSEAERRPHEHAFESRRALVVADQHVGDTEREAIHRARERNADVVVPRPPEVLHRRGEAGFENLNGHGARPFDVRCWWRPGPARRSGGRR